MVNLIKQSLASGILVGIGVVVNTQIANPYVGAALFSLALLVIIECDLKLYTGKIGFLDTRFVMYFNMLIWNVIGVCIPVKMMTLNDNFIETMIEAASVKFSQGYLEMLFYGILCGVLMFIAVYCGNRLITMLCIMVFILSGFEHCIADCPYLCVEVSSWQNWIKWLLVVIGNSVGAIGTRYLIGERKGGYYQRVKTKGGKR